MECRIRHIDIRVENIGAFSFTCWCHAACGIGGLGAGASGPGAGGGRGHPCHVALLAPLEGSTPVSPTSKPFRFIAQSMQLSAHRHRALRHGP